MRRSLALFVFALVLATAPAFAQVNFDSGATCAAFPSPIGTGGDPEGVSWNGAGSASGNIACKSASGNGGFPVFGAQYAEMRSNTTGGGFAPPLGGPVARPIPAAVNEMAIPIPAGTTYVSFSWDWHRADPGFNDGTSIDIVTAGGGLLAALAYADDSTLTGGATGASCSGFVGSPTAPAGPNYTAKHFAATPAGAYLSIACWNGSDNIAPSHVRIDNIRFGTARSAVTFDRPGPDCGYTFPLCGVGGDPEGVGINGAGGVNVSGVAGCGFPIGGCGKSLRVESNGPAPVTPPAGGPIARPVASPVNEVCVPLPAGSTDISFCWDFYTNKGSSGQFNDGLSIDIVNSGGGLIQSLVYADTFTPSGPCSWGGSCGSSGLERAPAGPNYFKGNFAPIPGGAYLSIACWNGGDNNVGSSAAVDNIVTGGPQLDYHSPGGAGSGTLSLQNLGFTAGDTYYMTATVNGAGFPNGWFYGINISIGELVQQVSGGLPFAGTLNACGHSCFGLGSVPPGIGVYLVTVTFDPAGQFREASAPIGIVTL